MLHTKLWVVDRTHVYVGSANMDWRSLSQVKELGLVALNCSCLANDYAKIFDVSPLFRYSATSLSRQSNIKQCFAGLLDSSRGW